jgi:hypothetical protein
MVTQPAPVFLLCICSVLLSSRPGYAKEKITFTPKEAGQHQAKPESCEIRVFQDSKPEQANVELGIINFHDERHRSKAGSLTLEVVMPKIKARACKVGADALIDIRVTDVRRLEFAMFNVRATVVRFVQN